MSRRSDTATAGVGGTVASRVAGHLQRAIAQTKRELGPYQAGVAQVILRDFTNHVSDELRDMMGPIWRDIAANEEVAPWLRELTRKLGNDRGQALMWIAGTSTSLAMGGGLGLLLTNELQPVIGPAVRGNPHMPLSASDAAAAVPRGLATVEFAHGDGGQSGLSNGRINTLIAMNTIVLSAAEIIELLGKGWITEAEAAGFFRRAGWDPRHSRELFPLQRTWVSPRDGGSMFQRSIVDMKGLREIIIRNGHHISDAEKYAELAGEPLPIQDLMTAQRRGIIDTARARRGWVQGPVRNEWFDVAQDLQYAPMSTVDAADSVNQGHMPLPEARKVAQWNGLMAEHFDTLIENAGLPPGVELATEAWNRGLITEAEFTRAFLESRLKNRYVPLYKKLRFRVIPQETVRRLFRLGVYTRDQAAERLTWAGFSPEDREALLAAEELDTDDSTRDLTKTEIISLFVDRAITRVQAKDMLASLGYATGEVEWLLTIAELRRARRYADAVIARVRAGYVAFRLDLAEASSIMDRLKIPADQREELIDLWDLERLSVTRGLSAAQVKTAAKKGLITAVEAMQRLRRQGYDDSDADLFLKL